MQRYFSNKKINNKLFLNNEDVHHIKNVMRLKENDKIEIVFEKNVYVCKLSGELNEAIIDLKLEFPLTNKPYICLIVPILKEIKMDLILQKATELGVDEIVVTNMERCMVKLDGKEEKKLNRWNLICKEASEQSKRNTIPIVNYMSKFKSIKEIDGLKLVCSTKEKNVNFKFLVQSMKKCDKMIIVIGPEGGLSLNEEKFLIENEFYAMTLGNCIMRVETVPLYIMSALNYEYME